MWRTSGTEKIINRHDLRRHIRRLGYNHIILLLCIACCSASLSFSITIYLSSSRISGFISNFIINLIVSPNNHLVKHSENSGYQSREYPGKQKSIVYDLRIKYDDFSYMKPSTLTYKIGKYDNNIEVLFRLPQKTSISALLLIFHSCRRTATDWFHTVERQRIIGAAIALGYGCLVFQATNNISRCWSNNADVFENTDVDMVIKGLDGFYKENPILAFLPRFTFGVSSGGIFSSIFAINHRYPIHGQVIHTSIVLPEILHHHVKTNSYPPTVFIHMLRDSEFATEHRINFARSIFNEQKIPNINLPIEPIRVKFSTFHDRIPSVSMDTSKFIVTRLHKYNWLGAHNFLQDNPRRKRSWEDFLYSPPKEETKFEPPVGDRKNQAMHENLLNNRNAIYDLFNVIYGEHEVSYERAFEALKWLKEVHNSPTTALQPKT